MIVLCANTLTPRWGAKLKTQEGLESTWGINYLANFHLLSILSPALRIQPPDRDVRIIFATCSSYMAGDLKHLKDSKKPLPLDKQYSTSKLALMVFAQAFQKHLDAYERPDKQPNNARVVVVDPGWTRTPGMRRWLSMGTLWGLVGYLLLWPVSWLVLKSPEMGAQTILYAAMDADLGRGSGGRFLKECQDVAYVKEEIKDEVAARKLWEFSEKQIIALEKEGAVKRALAKKEEELREKETANNGDQSLDAASTTGHETKALKPKSNKKKA
jgi:NAD(P)-dependent dehydrogenase (short-subunit alcohol dehydrogenase family)